MTTKGEMTREMIVMRAAEVFNTRGYAGTSMSHIMEATGLEKGGIYNHFNSKEEIALAAFDYAMALRHRRIQEAIGQARTTIDKLTAIIQVLQIYMSDPVLPGGCMMMNTIVEADDTHPGLLERAKEALTQLQQGIARIVNEGIANGEIKPTVDGNELATIMISLMEGAIVVSRAHKDSTFIEQAIDHLSRHIEVYVKA